MIKITLKYILAIFITLTCFTACKRKTTIKIKVYNAALAEYVANATVAIVEKKGDAGAGILGAAASCKEIFTATTDANGECTFDKEKLKTKNKVNYFCAVTQSWGQVQYYSCGNRTDRFLTVGKTNDIIVGDEAEAYFQIQYNNLLNPSQAGDSLVVGLITIEYTNPKGSVVQGGGGVFGNRNENGDNNFPYQNIWLTTKEKTKAQRLLRYVKKRKLGVVTTSVDTIKVYPNKDNIIQINW